MKKYFLIPACLTLLSLTACEISGTGADALRNPFEQKPTPAYSESMLSGKIFGQDWKAQVAILRPSPSDKTQLSLEVYSTIPASACQVTNSSTPFTTVYLPADYQVREYNFDFVSGSLLVFSGFTDVSKNLVADAAKLKITTLDAGGFSGYLYARGTEENGTVSEINGKLQVIDCRKQVTFSVWDEFARMFDLVEFDGKSVGPLSIYADFNNSSFYNRTTGKYIRSLALPLVYSVGANSTGSYSVGPMEGLGTTTSSEINGVKTINYSFHGPINFKGTDITMNLDMAVVRSSSNVKVQYTLEVPGQITKTTHAFTLRK
jgi:hypothetical protein